MSGSGNDDILGMGCPISRRDFVGGTLVAAGGAALLGCSPRERQLSLQPSGSPWTGFGGTGDYAWSNGNTEVVRDFAHQVRDGMFDEASIQALEETYDIVVVGGGFTGMTAAYHFDQHAKAGQRLLLLENHAMPGGEAKQNEIDVDGHRVIGPQGSNGNVPPHGAPSASVGGRIWKEVGIPLDIAKVPLGGGAEKYHLASDHYGPMIDEAAYPTGYFFAGHGWSKDPIQNGFTNTPWSLAAQKELADFVANRRAVTSDGPDFDHWLDTISYQELLKKAGYGQPVLDYINPLLGVGNFGVCADAVSARAVKGLSLPATVPPGTPGMKTESWMSFPGGNATILRGMLRKLIPDSISGPPGMQTLISAPLNFGALDRPSNRVRIRLNSTAVRVEHEGAPSAASHVFVTYTRNGKIHRVRAKAVVMGIGGWIAKHVVRDLPESYQAAYRNMLYGPVLTINVAVRNWRFIDKLGFTNMRWFDGLGWHLTVRRDVTFDPKPTIFTPDSPTMLTLYTPVLMPGHPPEQQGALARQKLLDTSYATYERQVRMQMTEMFGAAGFDARRDIAGIVLNRWGHAYSAPQPGFFYGKNGQPGTAETLRKPHGRIAFAHSEFGGRMNAHSAMQEGDRAAQQAMEMI